MVHTPRPDKPFLNCVIYARDEIDSEPEVMGRLAASRFRRADGKQVVLPLETAERLKDFELGLRDAGLIGPSQALFQSSEDAYIFRVNATHASIDLGHASNSIEPIGLRGYGVKTPSAERFSQEPLVKGSRDRLRDEMCIVRRSRREART